MDRSPHACYLLNWNILNSFTSGFGYEFDIWIYYIYNYWIIISLFLPFSIFGTIIIQLINWILINFLRNNNENINWNNGKLEGWKDGCWVKKLPVIIIRDYFDNYLPQLLWTSDSQQTIWSLVAHRKSWFPFITQNSSIPILQNSISTRKNQIVFYQIIISKLSIIKNLLKFINHL